MLTRHTVNGGSPEKLNYYSQDESLSKTNYYIDADGQQQTSALGQTQWLGKGATALGLTGIVQQQDFEEVALGYAPQSGRKRRIRGKVPKQKDKERLFHDFTWSPPKSVTMGALVFGDTRLIEAHRETVREMAALIEARYATVRVQINKVRNIIHTGNLIMTAMEHYTNRPVTQSGEVAIDPQLHTHLLIMNSSHCGDGKDRALFFEEGRYNTNLGPLYRQKLALKVQTLGYQIRKTDTGFELASISDSDIEVFSKRTQQAKGRAIAHGDALTPANIKHHVHASRRSKKIPLTLEELQETWQAEAEANGIAAPVADNQPVTPLGQQSVSEELDSALAHLSERSVSFSRADIEAYVFSRPQAFESEALEKVIEQHPQLMEVDGHRERFTTLEAAEREQNICQRWTAGVGQIQPLGISPQLEAMQLSAEQRAMVVNTLRSRDRHQLWQGYAGAGKTTALRALKDEWQAQGFVVKGFAPTIEAAKVLSKELGITTQTVARLVLAQPEQNTNQVWILDEASLISSRQMQAVLQRADQVQARILLVGDKGQNSAVEAGSPFRLLQGIGVKVHQFSKVRRQQDRSQRAAVLLLAEGKGQEGLALLESEGYIQEISRDESRAGAIAGQYLALSPQERQQTLIVSGTNRELRSITAALRKGLIQEGSLKQSASVTQLIQKPFSNEQKRRVDSYQAGDLIRLHRDYQRSPLQKNALYKVTGIDGDQLLLASFGGRPYRLDPRKCVEKSVYSLGSIELAVGDQVRWTQTQRKKGRTNGQQMVITGREKTGFRAVDREGRTHHLPFSEPLAVDHDWVSTTYRAQGKTYKRVIVSATMNPTSSQEPFYVKISRQTQQLTVYTEDLVQLREWVQRSNVQENVMDLLPEIELSQERDLETTQKYPAMAQLAQVIKVRRERVQLGKAISKMAGLIEEMVQPLMMTPPQKFVGIDQLAQAIRSFQDQRSFAASGVIQQIEELVQSMAPPRSSELSRKGIKELAAAIKTRREQRAIVKHLPLFEEFAQVMEQWGNEQPDRQALEVVEETQTVDSKAEVKAARVEKLETHEAKGKPAPKSNDQERYEQLAKRYPTDDLILIAARQKWGIATAREVIAHGTKGRTLKRTALTAYVDGVQKVAAQREAARQKTLVQQQNQKKKKRRRGR